MMHWFKRSNNYPEFYKGYLERISDKGFSNIKISLDIETTSLEAKKAEVISFGSINVVGNQILSNTQFQAIYKVDKPNHASTAIHEIINTSSQKRFSEDIPSIIEKISNHTILGHYIGFDINVINHYLKKLSLPKLKNPSIDTLELALKKDRIYDLSRADRNNYTLYSQCNKYGIDISTTHNALEDAFLAAMLYLKLSQRN